MLHLLSRTLVALLAVSGTSAAQTPLRVAVAGLVHGHVEGFLLKPIQGRSDMQLVGVYEPDRELQQKYAGKYKLGPTFTDLNAMLESVKPDAVATFTNTRDHAMVVEACAARRIPVMMEKPLAIGNEDAQRIRAAAKRSGIAVMVNYETTWYPSMFAIEDMVKDRAGNGVIRRMVAMDGHSGPKEIGVGPEFLDWLIDPVRNGAGALFDFGCYGANLMTWLMGNQRPLAVTAMTSRHKPTIYPRVDDDTTILLEYPGAQGVIEASWNWPFSRKDFEVYTEHAYALASGGNSLRMRRPNATEQPVVLGARPPNQADSLAYLVSVVRGGRKPTGLSSLENNMIVTEILDAARESARTGRRMALSGHE